MTVTKMMPKTPDHAVRMILTDLASLIPQISVLLLSDSSAHKQTHAAVDLWILIGQSVSELVFFKCYCANNALALL